MQQISKDKGVGGNTIQDSNLFNSKSLATQAKKLEHSVPMMISIKKAFDAMGDDRFELSVENESLKLERLRQCKTVRRS